MKARSIKGNSAEEIRSALQQCITAFFKPTLAIVFLSVKQDRSAIAAVLDKENIAFSGATTNGEFIDEELSKGSIAILLMDIDPAYFTILFDDFTGEHYREASKAMATKALRSFAHPAFLLSCSNLSTDAEEVLHGFEDIIGKQVNVFGGLAGDDYSYNEQFVFTNGKESSKGIVAIALDEDKMIIKGRATCGWNAAGTVRTITKSEGRRVYTIDDIPALDITAKYSGIKNATEDNKDLLLEMATNFPLQLQKENGASVMRPAYHINWDDHSYLCSGLMPQGAKVRFSLQPDFDVIEKVIAECEDLKATEIPIADAVIVYSCGGRLISLGPLMADEIGGIKNVWNVPMVGFFSNAELARATNGNIEMHNITTCCVVLKER
jgi:hypothetical protein